MLVGIHDEWIEGVLLKGIVIEQPVDRRAVQDHADVQLFGDHALLAVSLVETSDIVQSLANAGVPFVVFHVVSDLDVFFTSTVMRPCSAGAAWGLEETGTNGKASSSAKADKQCMTILPRLSVAALALRHPCRNAGDRTAAYVHLAVDTTVVVKPNRATQLSTLLKLDGRHIAQRRMQAA